MTESGCEAMQGLVGLGYEIVSTGGSAAAVEGSGVPVTLVETLTGFPEMLDGERATHMHAVSTIIFLANWSNAEIAAPQEADPGALLLQSTHESMCLELSHGVMSLMACEAGLGPRMSHKDDDSLSD